MSLLEAVRGATFLLVTLCHKLPDGSPAGACAYSGSPARAALVADAGAA